MQSGRNSQSPIGRSARRNWARLVGDVLLAAGVVSLVLAAYSYFTDPARSDLSLPRPVALAKAPDATVVDPTQVPPTSTTAPATAAPTAAPASTKTSTPIPAPTSVPVPIGVPVRLVVPSVDVDSTVNEIGTAYQNGQLIWETIPFIVGHYRTTAKPGETGNAVFSGHVTSRNWGNVFIDLYKIDIGDEIYVYTNRSVFTYTVSKVRLVPPTQTDVMDRTPDQTITLITCGGDWLPDVRDYSRRLIVNGKLKSASAIPQ